jgi:hypothetical protein
MDGEPEAGLRLLLGDNLPCVRKLKFIATTDFIHGRKVYPNLAAAIITYSAPPANVCRLKGGTLLERVWNALIHACVEPTLFSAAKRNEPKRR